MSNVSRTTEHSRQSGLTLIELLVAITILAFIAVLGWRGLDSIVRTRVALTANLEQTRGMQLTFAQLQSDCAHLAEAAMLPNRIPVLIEQNRLKLVRTVFADNLPTRLQVVTYQVKDGVLSRRESDETRNLNELDELWTGSISSSSTDVQLLKNVASFDMRLWIKDGWRSGVETLLPPPATPAGSPTPLRAKVVPPTGLEFSLRLKGHDSSLLKLFLLGAV
ncbi:MAG: prepilin-type N-terminal cleavage/methylation domain-containing protein [Gallionella sp.]